MAKEKPSDIQIVEAYTIVNEHCTILMHILEENDIWINQAYQDWCNIEQELINLIIQRMEALGIPMPDNQGTYYIAKTYIEHINQ